MLSLAAGTVLDVSPPEAVTIAAAAGFDAVGIWFDPGSWSATTERGALPIDELLDAVPGVPLSPELRSRALVERYPDPLERGRAVHRSCVRLR